MAFWALSDPHLSFGDARPMHVFGENWRNHWNKIERAWRARVGPEDVVLVTGDVSWAHRFAGSLIDLAWLDRLPGAVKLLVRGNHDLWWPEGDEQRARLPPTLRLLGGTAVEVHGEIFCGTSGWLAPHDPYFEPLDRPSYVRELAALRRALEQAEHLARGRPIHVLIHFPPYTSVGLPTAFDRLLRDYPVRTVTFGHLHYAEEWARAPRGWIGGIHYSLAAADFLEFSPVLLPI
jgi:predicted phosphohydrolase